MGRTSPHIRPLHIQPSLLRPGRTKAKRPPDQRLISPAGIKDWYYPHTDQDIDYMPVMVANASGLKWTTAMRESALIACMPRVK